MPKELILSGIVQGVFCRYYCNQNARRLGLRGAASNLPNGTVQVLLYSDDDNKIESYVKALKENPYDFRFFGRINNITVKDYSGPIRGDYTF
jgi:acylphosphatase